MCAFAFFLAASGPPVLHEALRRERRLTAGAVSAAATNRAQMQSLTRAARSKRRTSMQTLGAKYLPTQTPIKRLHHDEQRSQNRRSHAPVDKSNSPKQTRAEKRFFFYLTLKPTLLLLHCGAVCARSQPESEGFCCSRQSCLPFVCSTQSPF